MESEVPTQRIAGGERVSRGIREKKTAEQNVSLGAEGSVRRSRGTMEAGR